MLLTSDASATLGVPAVFCWTKMGTEAGQDLRAILQRKELERQSGGGIFAWGIGNSVGAAVAKARTAAGELHALFTPMISAPRKVDAVPSGVVMWLAYGALSGETVPLPGHMLVTSRQSAASGMEKRAHYALLCRTQASLVSRPDGASIDSRLARNFASENPVGSSQVTAVVRYAKQRLASGRVYNVQFRATLVGEGVVRLAMPVKLDGDLLPLYERLLAASSHSDWNSHIKKLRSVATARAQLSPTQRSLFSSNAECVTQVSQV